MADPKKPTPPAAPKPPADDITPVVTDVIPVAAGPTVADLERQIADLKASHAAEVGRLKAAAGPPVFLAGKNYLVSIPDGPAWVVAVGPSEHPYECYKRATGVTGSQHSPTIHETDLPVGRAA